MVQEGGGGTGRAGRCPLPRLTRSPQCASGQIPQRHPLSPTLRSTPHARTASVRGEPVCSPKWLSPSGSYGIPFFSARFLRFLFSLDFLALYCQNSNPNSASCTFPPLMKALTIRQPQAWLVLNGCKHSANRTALTEFRGPPVTQAASRPHLNFSDDAIDGWAKYGVQIPAKVNHGGLAGFVGLVAQMQSLCRNENPLTALGVNYVKLQEMSMWRNGPRRTRVGLVFACLLKLWCFGNCRNKDTELCGISDRTVQ